MTPVPESRMSDEDWEADDESRYRIVAPHIDEGSVVVFRSIRVSDGAHCLIAVDHRMAQDIVEALLSEVEVIAYAEPWQVTGSWRP